MYKLHAPVLIHRFFLAKHTYVLVVDQTLPDAREMMTDTYGSTHWLYSDSFYVNDKAIIASDKMHDAPSNRNSPDNIIHVTIHGQSIYLHDRKLSYNGHTSAIPDHVLDSESYPRMTLHRGKLILNGYRFDFETYLFKPHSLSRRIRHVMYAIRNFFKPIEDKDW
jgi:hypothetical protein